MGLDGSLTGTLSHQQVGTRTLCCHLSAARLYIQNDTFLIWNTACFLFFSSTNEWIFKTKLIAAVRLNQDLSSLVTEGTVQLLLTPRYFLIKSWLKNSESPRNRANRIAVMQINYCWCVSVQRSVPVNISIIVGCVCWFSILGLRCFQYSWFPLTQTLTALLYINALQSDIMYSTKILILTLTAGSITRDRKTGTLHWFDHRGGHTFCRFVPWGIYFISCTIVNFKCISATGYRSYFQPNNVPCVLSVWWKIHVGGPSGKWSVEKKNNNSKLLCFLVM